VVGDLAAAVVAAVGRLGPAVVAALLDDVQLVAALRAHLARPERAVVGELQAERVAVAPAPDLRRRTALIRQRVAGRRFAVEREPDDRAERVRRVLGRRLLLAVAGADEEVLAVGVERDAVREVAVARHLRRLAPDDLEVLEGRRPVAGGQPRPTDHGTRAAVARLRPAEVDPLVVLEAGRDDHVAEASLPGCDDVGHARHLGALAGLGVAQSECAGALGDEQVARPRHEGHRPRRLEAVDLLHLERRVAARRRRRGGGRRGLVLAGVGVRGAARHEDGRESESEKPHTSSVTEHTKGRSVSAGRARMPRPATSATVET
jgi:hypothetical protein